MSTTATYCRTTNHLPEKNPNCRLGGTGCVGICFLSPNDQDLKAKVERRSRAPPKESMERKRAVAQQGSAGSNSPNKFVRSKTKTSGLKHPRRSNPPSGSRRTHLYSRQSDIGMSCRTQFSVLKRLFRHGSSADRNH